MTEKPTEPILDSITIANWSVERPAIRQMKLLTDSALCRMASELGLEFTASSDDVLRLWRSGLLRADLVVSAHPLEIEDLILVKHDEQDEFIYGDRRLCIVNDEGLAGMLNRTQLPLQSLTLLFHPFRYYVLFHVHRAFAFGENPTTILRSPDTIRKIAESRIALFNRPQSAITTVRDFAYWNDVTALAVAAEPFTFSKLFGVYSIPYPFTENEEEFHRLVTLQFNAFRELLVNIGLDRAKQIGQELRRYAEYLEPNKDIHRVLRLTERRYRLDNVKGRLGGATLLLAMAEVIRRSAERAFDIQLPEEDEGSFGGDAADLKNYYYGTERLLDNHKAKREFLRDLGLDYSVRLRWYVEGATELSAINSELENNAAIEVINFRGNFLVKQGKGLSFKENLLNDMNQSVFSWVSLDGDVVDNVRVLMKAVDSDEMFGMFFISQPDFEFANFTLVELVDILWNAALERGADDGTKDTFYNQTLKAGNGKELFEIAKGAALVLAGIDKGKAWGERLMEYARNNHVMLQPDGSSKTRPVIIAISEAQRAVNCNYHLSRTKCRLDRDTGLLVDCDGLPAEDAQD